MPIGTLRIPAVQGIHPIPDTQTALNLYFPL